MFNKDYYAFETWNFLVSNAESRKIITYGDLAHKLQIHPRSIRFVLEMIQSYCLDEQLPPLSILVVNKLTNLPGQGFDSRSIRNLQSGRTSVCDFDWSKSNNPFTYASDIETTNSIESMTIDLTSNPGNAHNIYNIVQDRGISQRIFRDSLLKAYEERCAFTEFELTSTLDAAHIIPWSLCETKDRINPKNGILMVCYIHRLFDRELITINNVYEILVNPETISGMSDSTVEKQLLSDINGKKMYLPLDNNLWPDITLIEERNSKLDWI